MEQTTNKYRSTRCRSCGEPTEGARQIDQHHRRGRREGDHPDNLVGLCRRCHMRRAHRREDPMGERRGPPAPGSGHPPHADGGGPA